MEVFFKSHYIDDEDVALSIIKDEHQFWFRAIEIAQLLEHKCSNEICFKVRPETWKKLGFF